MAKNAANNIVETLIDWRIDTIFGMACGLPYAIAATITKDKIRELI